VNQIWDFPIFHKFSTKNNELIDDLRKNFSVCAVPLLLLLTLVLCTPKILELSDDDSLRGVQM